ncbi:MAG: hypothetical protein LUE29_08545 [Lachnospiraceae bacterium]|nr:hypothetical protein [Lachnospiraceae bacterium]
MVADMHCHILPGIDDGSRNRKETEKMLKLSFAEGIDTIVATPHFFCGMSEKLLKERDEAFEQTKRMAAGIRPDAVLYPGNEVFYSTEVPDALKRGDAKTINGTRYVLVEFEECADFGTIEKACQNLFYAGYWPILAHIDRFEGTRSEDHVKELVKQQVVMQVNTDAVMGADGWRTRHYILKLMKHGLIHILGTDAHGCEHRRPQMKSCLKEIEKRFGYDYRCAVSEKNPQKIIKGEKLYG